MLSHLVDITMTYARLAGSVCMHETAHSGVG